MGKRTPQDGLRDWEEAENLDDIVVDKREGKRANKAKAKRRNRRYENRLLRGSIDILDLDGDSLSILFSALFNCGVKYI